MESTNEAIKLIAKAKELLKDYIDSEDLSLDSIYYSLGLLDQAIEKLALPSST